MRRETYDDADIVAVLRATCTIAVLGASPNPGRHSHRVMRYAQSQGYRVVPVNPMATATEILGEPVYASLADVPDSIDMVDVFRRQEAIPGVANEILNMAVEKQIRTVWLQLDLYDEDAARNLRAAGLTVIMDRCLKVEHGRLMPAHT